MNGYVEAGYISVLGDLAGYSALLLGRSRKAKKALVRVPVAKKKSEPIE